MSKMKKLLCVMLSIVMMLGSISVAASAAYTAYLDDAILDDYNTIDRVELDRDQKSSLLLDMLDVMLEKEDMVIDIPLIGTIDLTSTDAALDSIYDLTGNLLFGTLTVGDLQVLEEYRGNISTNRRSTAGITDYAVISSLVTYLSNCAPELVNMVDADFNWGIVKGFLPPEFRIIIEDLPEFIKETVWDALHPVNDETMPSDITLDELVQFMCDNQLGMKAGSERAIIMGFEGVMPGFDIDITTDNAYRALEEGIYQALNAFIVPLLNSELKGTIQDAVASNTENGGNLADLVDVNYVIDEYPFDPTKGLMEQLNTMFGHVVDIMLIPLEERPVGTTLTFEWDYTIAEGDTYIDLLEDNLIGVISEIIIAGGEDMNAFNPEGKTLNQLGDYIARVAVEQFVKHIDLPNDIADAPMEKVAYIGLRELCVRLIPEMTYPDLATTATTTDYRNALVEMGADIGAYYLNHNIGLNSDLNRTADQFLSDFADWCMTYVDGLFDTTDYDVATSGWDKMDAIIWSIFPKDWIPYTTIFADADGAGVESDLTFQSLLYYFFDSILNFDIRALDTFFKHNSTSTLQTQTARQTIIDFVSNVLNNAFTPAGAASCVPAGITTFEQVISPISNLKTILCNILAALAGDDTLKTTTINLVTMLMGAADPQSLGDVDMDISDRIYCENGTVPSTTLRISNRSEGVNSAWRNAEGTLAQDQMYQIELVSLANSAGLTASVTSGTKIPANGYVDVTVSGTVSATTEVRFDLSYYILDEAGARINDGTPLVASTYAHCYMETGNYDVTSAEVSVQNVTFDSFSTYLYTTDVYNASLFSIMATNALGLWNNGSKDIVRSIITGTLPTGITANAPESGAIVTIDNATLGVDSYGTVSPYSAATLDPDAAQPYGIYDLDIQFEVKTTGSSSSSTTSARDHIIVVYNDFGLPGVLGDVMDANRQRTDFADDATAEWTAYQNAVSAGYALLHGNPDHSKMFANVSAPDGSENAYYTAVQNINAAVAALDAKAKPTDATLLAALNAEVAEYAAVDSDDYKLYTYDRFEDAYNRANNLANSQVAPADAVGFVAPAIPAFDLVYATEQLELWGGRLLKKTVIKTHLQAAITNCGTKVEANYASDTWVDYATALANANSVVDDTSVDLLQTEVNDARIELLKTARRLKTKTIVSVDDITVVDSRNMYIYAIDEGLTDLEGYVEAVSGYTITLAPYTGTTLGTGSYVKAMSGTGVETSKYTIVLFGDVNGDGVIDSTDLTVYDNYINGTAPSNTFSGGAFLKAADLTQDGIVDSADRTIVYNHVNEIATIDQTNPSVPIT